MGEVRYTVAVGDARLTALLFGAQLETLDGIAAVRMGPPVADLDTDAGRRAIAQSDVLLTGWGTSQLTPDQLAHAPSLRAIIHAGGAASPLLPDGWGDRFALSVAAWENARPVAEYTLAMILLAGKAAGRSERRYRSTRTFVDRDEVFPDAGNHARVVGILSASRIGRQLIALLRPFDMHILVHDPYLSAEQANLLGVQLVGLNELFERSEVLSVHAPVLPETIGLIGARQLRLLRDGAVFINTARGVLVDQAALIRELRHGRIEAVLDVTDPDPLPADSELFDLPNVTLTPHIAGSMGREIGRLGLHVAAELARFSRGEPFEEEEPRSSHSAGSLGSVD